jgi:ribosomal protein S1
MAEKIESFLLEWAENYFKSRDAFHKKIVSISHESDSILMEFKDKKEKIVALPELENISNLDLDKNVSIITLNNRKNLDTLYNKWKSLSSHKSLKIYFINPLSSTERKWTINPHVHSMICDESSLKQGLTSLFETVEPLTEEILKARL